MAASILFAARIVAALAAAAPASAVAQSLPRVLAIEHIAGPTNEGVHNVVPTRDGGYLLLGTQTNAEGGRDVAIWKLLADLRPDPKFGTGGLVLLASSGDDQAVDAVELPASDGYLIAAQAGAGDGAFAGRGHSGGVDLALIRLAADGTVSKVTLLGGSEDDELVVHHGNFSEPGRRLLAAADDGFYLVAQTRSADGSFPAGAVLGIAGGRDALVLRLGADGSLDRNFGRDGALRIGTSPLENPGEREPNDFFFSLAPSGDGGLIAAGYVLGGTLPIAGGTVRMAGNLVPEITPACAQEKYCYRMDGLLVRADARGGLVPGWGQHGVRFFGGSRQEKLYDVTRDRSGRYLFVGRTSSYDMDLVRPAAEGGRFDAFIGRLTPDGALDPSFGRGGAVVLGGPEDDKAHRVLEYAPGAYVVAVQTESPAILSVPGGGVAEGDPGDVQLVFLDTAGKVTHALPVATPGLDKPVGLALVADGRIVLAGVSETGGASADDPGATQDVFIALVAPPQPVTWGDQP